METQKRQVIYTNVPYVDRSNIIEILQKAYAVHEVNVAQLKFLFEFEEGKQPILRKKEYRPSINIECVDNVCHQITKFHVGYEWGNPITLIQREEKEELKEEQAQAIAELNNQYEAEGIKTKTQRLGKDVTICNLGYTYVDVNVDWQEGESYFKIDVLSPFTTFIIRSSYYLDNRIMVAVTFREDDLHIKHYTCFTKDTRFDISEQRILFEEMNLLGRIPIVEWIANYDGMGIWEHEISEMNNLNLMISDFSNTVEQNMQAIWHTNDVDFPTEEITLEDGTKQERVKKPQNGEWLQTYTPQDGKTPIVEPLSIDYDYGNMLNNIAARRALILEKCYVPQRGDADNSTGQAQDIASGYSSLDVIAESIQACQEACKMEEIKLVLLAIKKSPYVPEDSILLKIKPMDVQPNVKRERLSEIASKVNAMSTLLSHGIYGLDAIQVCNIFPDPNAVWNNSKALIEKYQSSIFDKEQTNNAEGGEGEQAPNSDRIMQDMSDQQFQSIVKG